MPKYAQICESMPNLHVSHGFLQAMLFCRSCGQLLKILGEFIDIVVQHHLQCDFLVVVAIKSRLRGAVTHSIEHLFPVSVQH